MFGTIRAYLIAAGVGALAILGIVAAVFRAGQKSETANELAEKKRASEILQGRITDGTQAGNDAAAHNSGSGLRDDDGFKRK